jgi:hypothetical protein
MVTVKPWVNSLLRLVSGTYFVLTSIYCLLAFLPYTFFFLIKAPPYAWMPWFVRHQSALYWLAAAAAVAANWNVRAAWRKRQREFVFGVLVIVAAGTYLAFHPFLATLEDNRQAYWWSLIALVPLVLFALWRQTDSEEKEAQSGTDNHTLGYSAAVLIACTISVIYTVGSRIRIYHQARTITFRLADAELTLWSLLSHLVLAVAVVSVINLVFLIAARTANPTRFRRVGVSALVLASLWIALSRFLENTLSFAGWSARAYAAALALGLTLWGFSIVLPFLKRERTSTRSYRGRTVPSLLLTVSIAVAILFPIVIGGADWSGFLEGTVTLIVWVAISGCLLRLRPVHVHYSVLTIVLVVAGCGAAYKLLQASEIFWSRPLGSTDDEISLALESYGEQDTSFQLTHHILGNGRSEVCGDLCRILRDYTNIRDAQARVDVQLVDKFVPAKGSRPYIFLFVIDSMRPDYLGAYNPRVDYTPNLDAFARDSVVLHNVYSQYAGTSLSEPAIWSGAMMLHAHYPQPFSRLNSLDRMLHADDYQMMVSVDEVLSTLLPADDHILRLDADKKLWNQLELGRTLKQAQAEMDALKGNTEQPIFLYAQPKNVHQFARNEVPSPNSQHWQAPEGMSIRISYEVHWVDQCLGEFFRYLKQRGMYDNSIIIVTSDHGDATGEFGRSSHSTSIWPEIMRVPLIVHLPPKMREHLVYDDTRLSTLTDLAPTLYYLLGHRPVVNHPLYGRPLFAETREELDLYQPQDLLLASDVRAVYGILTADGRYFYATYDSPAQSYLFDLKTDPNAEHNILSPMLKQRYDEEIIEHLQRVGDYYGYKPGVGSMLASAH